MRDTPADTRRRAVCASCLVVTAAMALLPIAACGAPPAAAPEIGEVLRATPPVRCAPLGKSPEQARDARIGDPLHPGDRLLIGPGGMAVVCFYQTGLRYRLTVAAGSPPVATEIAANGRQDLVGRGTALRCEPLATVGPSVALRLSPDARSRFGPLKASSGIRGFERNTDGSLAPPALDDALANVVEPATIQYGKPLTETPPGATFAFALYQADAAKHETRVWRSDPLTADALHVVVPGGTLKPGVRYRWSLEPFPEEATSALPPVPLATGHLDTLTAAQNAELTRAIATARQTPAADTADPDPLLLEAGVLRAYGLETRVADAYRAAIDRCPTDTALQTQLTPLTQRAITFRPAAPPPH